MGDKPRRRLTAPSLGCLRLFIGSCPAHLWKNTLRVCLNALLNKTGNVKIIVLIIVQMFGHFKEMYNDFY